MKATGYRQSATGAMTPEEIELVIAGPEKVALPDESEDGTVPRSAFRALLVELAEIREAMAKATAVVEDARISAAGLIGYEGLRDRLSIDGVRPCLRTVKEIVRKNKGVVLPVKLGSRLVGFRPARVEALLAHLAGERLRG